MTQSNADRLLSEFDGAIGVKTGYTNRAGHCFVGAVSRNDETLISVVLASGWGDDGKEGKWTDTKKIMEYGFDNFSMVELAKEFEVVGEIEILESETDSLNCITQEGFSEMLSQEELDRIDINVDFESSMKAPVMAGQKVGVMEIILDGEVLKEIELLTNDYAKRYNLLQWLNELKKMWINW